MWRVSKQIVINFRYLLLGDEKHSISIRIQVAAYIFCLQDFRSANLHSLFDNRCTILFIPILFPMRSSASCFFVYSTFCSRYQYTILIKVNRRAHVLCCCKYSIHVYYCLIFELLSIRKQCKFQFEIHLIFFCRLGNRTFLIHFFFSLVDKMNTMNRRRTSVQSAAMLFQIRISNIWKKKMRSNVFISFQLFYSL